MCVAGKIFCDGFLPIILLKMSNLLAKVCGLYFFSLKACRYASLLVLLPGPLFPLWCVFWSGSCCSSKWCQPATTVLQASTAPFEPPRLHCERSRPSKAPFWASTALDFWPWFGLMWIRIRIFTHICIPKMMADPCWSVSAISNTSWFLLNILV